MTTSTTSRTATTPTMANTMRVSIGLPRGASDDQLRFAKQLGCDGVVLATPTIPGAEQWEYEDLGRLREHVERFGLRVDAMQNTPADFLNKIRLGLPGKEAQLEHYQATVRNLGKAGIPVLGYNWRPNPLYRTGHIPGRGGAVVTSFNLADVKDQSLTFGREFPAEEMWANYEYFIKAVIPVAEEAGVQLAIHPDDPPGPPIGGVARIFSSFEGFKRASEIVDSPAWSILFCMGCWSEIGGSDYVLKGLRYFAERGKIAYVHFRDVQGTGDVFQECFIGEGNVDITAALRILRNAGFGGFLIDDHVPHMVDDTGWAPRGRAYATGYILGLLRALTDMT